MINGTLASMVPGPMELIVIFAVLLITFAIPAVVLFILFVIYVIQKNKEQQKLHMEVEKLIEEVNKLKQVEQ